MSSPFPDMDPFLEHPSLWPDIHNSLIAAIQDELSPQVAPRYSPPEKFCPISGLGDGTKLFWGTISDLSTHYAYCETARSCTEAVFTHSMTVEG